MFNIKTVGLFCVGQTIILLFLTYRMMFLEAQLSEVASAGPKAAQPVHRTSSITHDNGLKQSDIDAIRTLIKDEIRVLSKQIAARNDGEPAPPIERVIAPAERSALIAAFETEFSQALNLRTLSPQQLGKLEETIARLPPEERRAALSRLSRALSTGAIDANL